MIQSGTPTRQQLFQAVVDALPVSLHAIDRQYRVVVWNRRREAGPFGRPRGEVLGRNLFEVIGEEPRLQSEYERIFAGDGALVTEVTSRAGGTPRIFHIEKVPMRLGDGSEVTHIITFALDVTRQRSLERAVMQSEKMAAIGQLTAGIAHEINNPLATIASCAEAMRARLALDLSETDREEVGEDAQVIEEEAYRCKGILQNLLDLSRSAPAPSAAYCNPRQVIDRTAQLLRHNPRLSGIEVEIDCPTDIPPVRASEDHLVQVMLVLLSNAADALEGSGHVWITIRATGGDDVSLSVEDDGPGVPPELRERVFEPFFTTKPPGRGTGLGLAVAYGLIRAHEGRLEIRDREQGGTRFEVLLPAAVEAATEVS